MKTVMIVDDALFMRHTLRNMLEKSGFCVVGEAENAEMAIEEYQKLKPDLVTMDITMPGPSGIYAIKEIRSLDTQARIIVISSQGQEYLVREAILSGARGFVLKPFTEKTLMDAVEKVIG